MSLELKNIGDIYIKCKSDLIRTVVRNSSPFKFINVKVLKNGNRAAEREINIDLENLDEWAVEIPSENAVLQRIQFKDLNTLQDFIIDFNELSYKKLAIGTTGEERLDITTKYINEHLQYKGNLYRDAEIHKSGEKYVFTDIISDTRLVFNKKLTNQALGNKDTEYKGIKGLIKEGCNLESDKCYKYILTNLPTGVVPISVDYDYNKGDKNSYTANFYNGASDTSAFFMGTDLMIWDNITDDKYLKEGVYLVSITSILQGDVEGTTEVSRIYIDSQSRCLLTAIASNTNIPTLKKQSIFNLSYLLKSSNGCNKGQDYNKLNNLYFEYIKLLDEFKSVL